MQLDLSKYVDLFLSEGREHIAELNDALMQLEKDPASGDAVAAAFRAVHSIKGMASAMGYTVVTERANALESMISAIRSGDETVTPPRLEHLIEESDALARDVELAVLPVGTLASKSREGDAVSSGSAPAASDSGEPHARTGSSHVRVRASRLDSLMDLVGEIEIARDRLERELRDASRGSHNDALSAAFDATSRLLDELREQVIAARMVPVGQVFERFPRLVRETAKSLEKDVDFALDGSEIEIDRSILDRVGDPVLHLLRNALDHGIEPATQRVQCGKSERGRLTLSAQREAGYVLIRVADDGRGIDRDRVLARARDAGIVDDETTELDDVALLRVLAHPGFSTAASVTDVSGRGVGLDVVDSAVRTLGGVIEIKSVMGRGTAITLRLPLSIAIVRALIARVGEELFAIPFTHVQETLEMIPSAGVLAGDQWSSAEVAGVNVGIVMLRSAFGLAPRVSPRMLGIAVVARGRRAALLVDGFAGQQDVVVKRFDPPRGGAPMFAGATVLGDGSPALIVDVNSLI